MNKRGEEIVYESKSCSPHPVIMPISTSNLTEKQIRRLTTTNHRYPNPKEQRRRVRRTINTLKTRIERNHPCIKQSGLSYERAREILSHLEKNITYRAHEIITIFRTQYRLAHRRNLKGSERVAEAIKGFIEHYDFSQDF